MYLSDAETQSWTVYLFITKQRQQPRDKNKQHLSHLLLFFQNVTANHRANDVIAAEDGPQVLVGRFMYGPLDMVALTGEKVKSEQSIFLLLVETVVKGRTRVQCQRKPYSEGKYVTSPLLLQQKYAVKVGFPDS